MVVDISPIPTEFPHPHAIPMKFIPIPITVKKFTHFVQNMYVNEVILFNAAVVL